MAGEADPWAEIGAVPVQRQPQADPWAEVAAAPQPAPRVPVSRGEAFTNSAVNTYPLGNVLTNAIATLAYRTKGERARLTPQAKAELEAMGIPVKEAPDPSLIEDYRVIRDTRRERLEQGRKERPNASRAGTVTGVLQNVVAPLPKVDMGGGLGGRLAGAALTGAAYGGLDGLTNGDADLTRGEVGKALRQTLSGAEDGAAMGLVAGTLVEGARPLAGALKRLAIRQGKQAISGESTISAATKEPLSDAAVEDMLQAGAIRPGSTTQAIAARIEAIAKERGDVYGGILDALEAQGVRGPNAKELADQIYKRFLAEYPNYVSSKTVPNLFRKVAANIEDAAGPGHKAGVEGPANETLGLRQAERIKQELQDQARFDRLNAKPTEEALREMSSTVRGANEAAVEAAGSAPGASAELKALAERFVPAKQTLAKALEARHFARPGASKAEQRSPVGLMSTMVGLGTSGGNPVQAAANAAAYGFARNRLPSTVASGSYALSDALRTGAASGNLARGVGGAVDVGEEVGPDYADDPNMPPNVAALLHFLRMRRDGTADASP